MKKTRTEKMNSLLLFIVGLFIVINLISLTLIISQMDFDSFKISQEITIGELITAFSAVIVFIGAVFFGSAVNKQNRNYSKEQKNRQQRIDARNEYEKKPVIQILNIDFVENYENIEYLKSQSMIKVEHIDNYSCDKNEKEVIKKAYDAIDDYNNISVFIIKVINTTEHYIQLSFKSLELFSEEKQDSLVLSKSNSNYLPLKPFEIGEANIIIGKKDYDKYSDKVALIDFNLNNNQGDEYSISISTKIKMENHKLDMSFASIMNIKKIKSVRFFNEGK